MAAALAQAAAARPILARPFADRAFPDRPVPTWVTDMQRMLDGGADRCRSKVAYSSEQQARAYGSGFLKKTDQAIARLWPYACTHCRRWHLTKRPGTGTAITASARHEGVLA